MGSLNLVEDYSSNKQYLNCDVSGREDIVDFEINMFDNNVHIPGLVSMFRIVQDAQTILRYDVTGLISIDRYFGITFSKRQLWNLVMGFCTVDETIEEYMLRAEGLCTSFNRIFVDPPTGEIKMLYLPVKESINEKNISMVQCTNIVLNAVVADLSEDAGYYEAWKQLAGDSKLDSLQVLKKKMEAFEERKENRVRVMQERVEEEKKKAKEEAEERMVKLQQEVLEQQKQDNSKGKLGIFGSKDKNTKPSKNVDTTNNSEPIVRGMAIPGGGVVMMPDGGFMDKSRGSNRTEKLKKEKAKNEKPVKEKKGLFGKKVKNNTNAYEAANIQTAAALYQPDQAMHDQQFVHEDSLHTILDTSQRGNMPKPIRHMSLQRRRAWLTNSAGVMTEVSKLPFVVGRQAGAVDIVIENNPEISKRHMIITYSDGTYFITDNSSTNHTYLNGRELPVEVPYPVAGGDVIVLGQESASVAFRFQTE